MLSDRAPSGREWVHELKLDGYRMGCFVDRGQVRLMSRQGNDWTQSFPEVVQAAAANGDILELHTWNSHADDVERPNRLVFDLDPAPDVTWALLADTASMVRARLQAHGLESWVKSTGGKGLHVVVPLQPSAGWDECFAFSRSFAEALARESPSTLTVAFSKARRAGKILLDYKRNYRTSISVAAFSTRARPEGTVSAPLSWDAIDSEHPPRPYTVADVRARVAAWVDDPWSGYWKARQRLPRAGKRTPFRR